MKFKWQKLIRQTEKILVIIYFVKKKKKINKNNIKLKYLKNIYIHL